MLVTTVGNNEIHSVYRSIGITNDVFKNVDMVTVL